MSFVRQASDGKFYLCVKRGEKEKLNRARMIHIVRSNAKGHGVMSFGSNAIILPKEMVGKRVYIEFHFVEDDEQ